MSERMKMKQRLYEPHLAIRMLSIQAGGEWQPEFSGWSLIQISDGTGYCLQAQGSAELEAGMVLLIADQARPVLRASQLWEMSLHAFNVMPARLTGLITLGEEGFLKLAAARKDCAIRILPPQNLVATKMKELSSNRHRAGLMFRLKLLQLFVEAFGDEWAQTAGSQKISDAKERLWAFLQKTPPGELVEMNFGELARKTNCTARHLSRIFHELIGMSFRDKRAEIRLARARELLATSDSKVVEVALESGYKSLSLFNLMFIRRFGVSPGRWRQKYNHRPLLVATDN
jgi:AraC-like DNA-binding protein